MKRSAAVIAAIVVLITLLIWAGVHNRRERMLAAQNMERNHVALMPSSKAGQGGTIDEGVGEEGLDLRGKPAPPFSLKDVQGKKVSLADFKGKPVLVNFWATWCSPCRLEMPWFEEFKNKYAAQGLQILGVSLDDEDVSAEKIAAEAKKSGVSYPILMNGASIEHGYGGDSGVAVLPMSFYVDRSGKVVVQTAGLGSKDQIEANIQKLLAADKQ